MFFIFLVNHYLNEVSKIYVTEKSSLFLVERPHCCINDLNISTVYQLLSFFIFSAIRLSAKLFQGNFIIIIVLGKMTQEEFDHNQILREQYLRTNNWKRINIISRNDLLPKDNIILSMIDIAKEYLNSGHFWITFDIDNNLIKSSQFEKYYSFGDLIKIK